MMQISERAIEAGRSKRIEAAATSALRVMLTLLVESPAKYAALQPEADALEAALDRHIEFIDTFDRTEA